MPIGSARLESRSARGHYLTHSMKPAATRLYLPFEPDTSLGIASFGDARPKRFTIFICLPATRHSQCWIWWEVGLTRVEPTLFHEAWWLDLATNGMWRSIDYVESGKLVAWIPYCPERILWLRRSRMPTLTHFLGPVVTVGSSNAGNRAQSTIHATRQILQQFPKIDCFRQTTHREVQDVLAFQMEGFTTVAQFTFIIDPTSPDNVWRSMRGQIAERDPKCAEKH